MKLLFFTGSRSEWGYIKPILHLCKQKNIKYNICATNMHLLDSYGNSVKEIEKEGFKVSDKIFMTLDGYNNFTMAKSMGVLMTSFVDVIQRLKPSWIVLAGDRAETFIAGVVAAYTYTPIAHIQAGELSGNIDGLARHALGKFAHIHFASNFDAYKRLIKLGEEKFRVKLVGASQLDDLKKINKTKITKKKILKKLGFLTTFNYILVVYHPVTEEFLNIRKNFNILNQSLMKINIKKIWILPNNDAGSYSLKSEILSKKDYNNNYFENLPRENYLQLLRYSNCIIGNSSSAIIESPSFRIPAINVGRRQNKRLRSKNIIDVKKLTVKNVLNAYKKSQSNSFKKKIQNIKNPYGKGDSSKRILDILTETKIDNKILVKDLTY